MVCAVICVLQVKIILLLRHLITQLLYNSVRSIELCVNCVEITGQSKLNFYCLQNLLFIKTCFGLPAHLHVTHNIYRILGRILAAFLPSYNNTMGCF